MSIRLNRKGNITYINDHDLLFGRDKLDQHPIESITGLRNELDAKYQIPAGGIPPEVLDRTYVELDDYLAFVTQNNDEHIEFAQDILSILERLGSAENNINANSTEIVKIKDQIEVINNKLSNGIPGGCSGNGNCSGAYIEQVKFTANDIEDTLEVEIVDTDLKVIKPTIIEILEDGTKVSTDYTLSYPSDTIMRIEFTKHGTYIVNYLAGELTESQFNVLIEYIKKLENKIEILTPASGGTFINPKHNVEIKYDDDGRIVQEKYTGDISKTIDYEYNFHGDIAKKTVILDGELRTAIYQYNEKNELVIISDNGTEIPIDGTKARPFDCVIEYDRYGKIHSETYTGGIKKEIVYGYNSYGDISIKKITENGETKEAIYRYDDKRNLVSIRDEGTEKIALVFNSDCGCQGGTGGEAPSLDIDLITEPEINLIFETILK